MIRATLDVNILASGFLACPGIPKSLIDSWTDLEYELVISEHVLDGLIRTWRKPYFQHRLMPGDVQRALALLRSDAMIVLPHVEVYGVGEDEEGDLVLSTALTGSAEFLVTGDRHLQQVGSYQGLIILPPRDFLDVLAKDVT